MQSRGNNNESNTGDGGNNNNNNSNSPANENDAVDNGDSKRETFSSHNWDQELADFRVTKRSV